MELQPMTRAEKMAGRQTFTWLLAAEIEMAPPQWARPLRTPDIRSIAAAFDPDKFGVVYVWYRPDLLPHRGRYTVVDGQHRLGAMRLMHWEDQRVPCILYEGLTMETAAELSLGLQDRRNLHAIDRYRGELVAHEHCAVEIDKVLRALDLEMVYASRQGSVRRLSCIAQLKDTWEKLGAPGLERVLRVCDGAWSGTSAGFASSAVKLVTILVAAHNGEVNDVYLAETMGSRSPAEWVTTGARAGRSLASIAQDVIVEYNKRRRGPNRLPELTPSEYSAAVKRKPVKSVRGAIPGVTATTQSRQRRRRGQYDNKEAG